MNRGFSRFKDILFQPTFWLVWVLLAIIIAAFILDLTVFANTYLLFLEGALLFFSFVLVFVTVYRAAAVEHDTKIDRIELTGILEGMDDSLIVYEEGFRAIFFNPAAERLFRLPAKAIIDHRFTPQDIEKEGWRTLVQVIFPSLAPRVIARSKDGEYPQVVDLSFTDPRLELRVTNVPLLDERGRTLAFIKIIRNRTALLEAVRSKSEFVTVASHQLRGPVTDIKWALDSLTHANELTDANRTIVQTALAAGEGLLRRIEDLLSIAKMEEGDFGYNFEESNVVDFIGGVLTDILPAAKKANIKVYFDRPAGDLPRAIIDPKRLSLALVNLLENSIRYNVENGEVIVKADKMQDKPFIMISVKDTGIGIPPEDIPKLFNKFYRAENALKMQTEGSGLGLYIAKGIVRAHGGEIWVESELNRGTTITFTVTTDPNLVPKHEAGMEYFL